MAKAAQLHSLWIRLRSTNGAWIAPPELRRRLVKDADREGSNLHDVAIGILARHYKVPFVPSGRHTAPSARQEVLNLRVSAPLWRALGAHAQGSRQKEALRVLCGYYELVFPVVRRVRAAA